MVKIYINKIDKIQNKWLFQVFLKEDDSETKHEVILDKFDYDRLACGRNSAEQLVRDSFEFLLERESKESILTSFNLRQIQDYFPEFEKIICA